MAQLAFTVAGAVIGNIIAPGVGGPYGAIIGSIIGGLLFPPKVSAPPLADAHLQVSSYGTFIPILYGSIRTKAIIIDGPDQFTKHEGDSGGKGPGGSKASPSTYSVDWLRCLACESTGDHRLGRVWHTGRLVGDYRPGALEQGELTLTFYNGASDQLPDPTEEAHYGAGMVSAYRNVASIEYAPLNLGDTGNALPNINFEIIEGETHIDKPVELVLLNHNNDSPPGHRWPISGEGTWGTPCPAFIAWPSNGDPIRIRAANTTAPALTYTYDSITLAYIGSETAGVGDGWGDDVDTSLGDWIYSCIGHYVIDDVRLTLWGYNTAIASFKADGTGGTSYIGAGPPISSTLPVQIAPLATFSGSNILLGSGVTSDDRIRMMALSQDEKMLWVGVTTAAQQIADASLADKWYRLINGVVTSSGTIIPKLSPSGPIGSCTRTQVDCAMFENDYRSMWKVNYNGLGLSVYQIDDSGNFAQAAVHFVDPPAGSGGALTLQGDAGEGIAIYALKQGCLAGVVAGRSLWLAKRCDNNLGVVRLSDIVDDQHVREGDAVGTYDTSELVDIVRGFGIFAPPTGRSVVDSLKDLYGFDPVDSDTGVKYVKLGKPSILVIPDDDLCAHDEHGNDIPSPLQVVLGNDIELPAQIWLKYYDFDSDYNVAVQNWHRQNTRSNITRTIESPLVLKAAEAKQMVDGLAERTLVEADKYTFYLLRRAALGVSGNLIAYAQLEPTDVVTVKGLDLRITKVNDQMGTGILKFEAVRNHPGVVIQTGAGAGGSPGFPDPSIPTPQDTDLVVGDWPYIREEDNQAVITIAMQGALRRSWKGASLMKSVDGTNYSSVLQSGAPDTIGTALTALPAASGYGYDPTARVQVKIGPGGGALSSQTYEAMLEDDGANLAMLAGEMIQFCDADLVDSDETGDTYDIARMFRALNGTEWFTAHAAGDQFVLLPTTNQIEAIHSEYGRLRYYKAVTSGRSLATADEVRFTSQGVSLAPYSPVHLGSGFNGSGDFIMRCLPRVRLHGAWLDFVDVPLDETVEKFQFQIWDDATYTTLKRSIIVERVIDYADTPEATYTSAQQDTDFDSPLPATYVWTVAKIGRLGPGYDSRGVLPYYDPGVVVNPGVGIDCVAFMRPGGLAPFDNTVVVDVTWGAYTRTIVPMGQDTAVVIRFTTPSGFTASHKSRVTAVEYQSPPSSRYGVLSPLSCDWSTQAIPFCNIGPSNTLNCYFKVGAAEGLDADGATPVLLNNKTYYFNIYNLLSSCSAQGICTIVVDFDPGDAH